MAVTYLDPEDHVRVPVYRHVAVGTGTKHIHIAGQVSWDAEGELVAPGDLAGQVVQVHRNVDRALRAAGATFHDVVRFTWYAVDWRRELMDDFVAGIDRAREELDVPPAPAALIGVSILYEPGILIEAEVTAIV